MLENDCEELIESILIISVLGAEPLVAVIEAVGAFDELPLNPMTMTYRTAANTTVIATINIVAMTGETAFRLFQLFLTSFLISILPSLLD